MPANEVVPAVSECVHWEGGTLKFIVAIFRGKKSHPGTLPFFRCEWGIAPGFPPAKRARGNVGDNGVLGCVVNRRAICRRPRSHMRWSRVMRRKLGRGFNEYLRHICGSSGWF